MIAAAVAACLPEEAPMGGNDEVSEVDQTTDADGLPYWHFFTSNSHTCKGDSGSPIISAGKLVSLVSTGDHDDEHAGPAISVDVRGWLVTHALDRDGDGWEAWADKCDTHPPNWPGGAQFGQKDDDGDGVSPPCDPCDDVAQEWLLDGDGDAIPDCVDPCPYAAGETWREDDEPQRWGDGDGVGPLSAS